MIGKFQPIPLYFRVKRPEISRGREIPPKKPAVFIDNYIVMFYIDPMKSKSNRRFHVLTRVLAGLCLLPLGACAVFSHRHRRWDRHITRGEDGVAEYSRPFAKGEGETALLLIHGFGDGPGVWERLAPALAEEGFHVRAMRLPGWGEPLAAKRALSPGDWEDAIIGEIAALRKTHARVIVAGHSLGGCLSASLAVRDKLDADALILYAPMFAVSDARSPVLPTRRWFAFGRAILPQRMVVESLFPDHTRVAEPRPRSQRDPFVPLGLFTLLYEAMDEVENTPVTISMPLRMVLPGEDEVVRSDVARAWFERLQAPEKTLREISEAGHVLPLDVDPGKESGAIRRWLGSAGFGVRNAE